MLLKSSRLGGRKVIARLCQLFCPLCARRGLVIIPHFIDLLSAGLLASVDMPLVFSSSHDLHWHLLYSHLFLVSLRFRAGSIPILLVTSHRPCTVERVPLEYG